MANEKEGIVVDVDNPDASNEFSKETGEVIVVQELDIPNIREKAIDRLKHGMNKDMDDLLDIGPQTNYLFDMMSSLSIQEAMEVLREAVEYHEDDSNFPAHTLEKMHLLLEGEEAYGTDHESYVLDMLLEATLLKFHSPYPEVRAVCDPMDDVNLPVETIRAYFLGIIWVPIGSFINQLFSFRQPSLTLQATAIQILLYPCGKFLEKVLPNKEFTFFGKRYSLNPGPWNNKEQMLATLMLWKLGMLFNQKWVSFGFMFLMNFSTQFFGFGLAGLLRRWVVYPPKQLINKSNAIWPSLLPTLMLNRTLLLPESKRSIHGWTITKYNAMLIYYWFPGFIFTAISTFNWPTWIAPQNKVLAIITGSGLGLGFNPWTTFDWGVINFSTPLAVPWFSTANQYFGMLVGGLIMIALYWKNYKWMGYLPINSTGTFNNKGTTFNASAVKYKSYSPPFISLGYLFTYGSEFVMFTLSFWPQIKDAVRGFWTNIRYRKRSNFENNHDAISKLMSRYPEVPDWWYLCLMILSLVFGIIACQAFPTNTPAWSIIIIILVAIIYSVTGFQLGFNDIGIVIAGYMVPEHAIANMMCRVYGWNVDAQAESFIGDQKLGHYAKIPPRALLRCQFYSQSNKFFCPFPHSLYTATLVWGVVGPSRVFNTLYPMLKWAFLIGVLAGAPCYYIRRYFLKYLKNFSPILFLAGMSRFQSGYNLSYYTPGLQFSFVFMYYIRRRYLAWWTKYNYVLTSALGAGVAFGAILVFVSLQVTSVNLNWWGTLVSSAGVDGTEREDHDAEAQATENLVGMQKHKLWSPYISAITVRICSYATLTTLGEL
ncbi:OPT oligopeptide transporter protein-domain-containing protein [Lipomyces chichibuensis]|uniref:OPT oligopeptide transporter protein-domain-containing protein n=1 Tax=Lipomyces chichibuensis TaxID=1546026 RepID=UPI00334367BE